MHLREYNPAMNSDTIKQRYQSEAMGQGKNELTGHKNYDAASYLDTLVKSLRMNHVSAQSA